MQHQWHRVDGGADSDDGTTVGPYGDYIDFEYIGCYTATDSVGFEHRVTELEMTHEVRPKPAVP